MAATTKTWANGLAPTCEDVDLNGFKNENNNLIVGSGQGINTGDNQQTHRAVAHYAGVGDYYVDSGVANAYVLSVTGVQVAPPTYATGMRIRFVAGNANTGASTVNVAGLGVKNILSDVSGLTLASDEIGGSNARREVEAYYDGTDFKLVSTGLRQNTLSTANTGTSTWTSTSTLKGSVSIGGVVALEVITLTVKIRGLKGASAGQCLIEFRTSGASTGDFVVCAEANLEFQEWCVNGQFIDTTFSANININTTGSLTLDVYVRSLGSDVTSGQVRTNVEHRR